jgi:(2S)-methylsuccinyl-CoA dehydrogenase
LLARPRVCRRALAHARQRTQHGQGIDSYQVHCERLAYRETEWRAAQELLGYAESQLQHGQDDTVAGPIALVYAAEVSQALLGEVEAYLHGYGLDESFVQETLGTVEVRQAVWAGSDETLVAAIGTHVLDTNGSNTIWLDNDLAEITRQSVRDFTQQEVEPIAERIHRNDELVPDDLIAKMGDLGFFAMSIPEAYGGTGMGYLGMIITTEEL